MKFRVHCYVTVRVPFEVEAADHATAIEVARKMTNETSFRNADAEDAEEITGFLVDEDGDTDYERSQSYDGDGEPFKLKRVAA